MDIWDEAHKKSSSKDFWNSIVNFVNRDDLTVSDFQEEENLRVAIAALMVHIALSDEEFSDVERNEIAEMLSARFELHENDVEQLLFRAEKMQDDAIDLYGFTNVITRSANHEERIEIVYQIWHVILADRHIDKFEDHVIRKICHILGVSQHDSIIQRDRVIQEIEGKE